ncbi:hypothetical protein O181_010316 [Austropuccinia psidii MF-1]|uniref:Uncharacterized protein n=1 Tax=Austropuccinia psidii MF-1 TaxID=1389203 RepID=A0A9Q3BTI9_9BASI|nr:hypothetical protein [Austropuccinia psidii MF-1]
MSDTHLLQDQQDLRPELKRFSLQLQELSLMEPQKTIFKGPGEDCEEEEENSVGKEESDGTNGVPDPVREYRGTGGPTVAQYNQPVSHKSEPYLLAIMKQMTQIMANLQADSSSEASRPPALKTPSMKAPECINWNQNSEIRSFIHSCQFIFRNDPEISFSRQEERSLFHFIAHWQGCKMD